VVALLRDKTRVLVLCEYEVQGGLWVCFERGARHMVLYISLFTFQELDSHAQSETGECVKDR
jgi:hypothetical protein